MTTEFKPPTLTAAAPRSMAQLRESLEALPRAASPRPENPLTQKRRRRERLADEILAAVKGKTVFTIGHSTHSFDHFVELLKGQSVTDLVDVRSTPYSKLVPWTKRESLEIALLDDLIDYRWLGDGLGGRPQGGWLYNRRGELLYPVYRLTTAYQAGLASLLNLIARKELLCLMSVSENPEECHRKLLIAPDLAEAGVKVRHIRAPKPRMERTP